MELRNLAIIAHVDHGKTTLVDCLLRQSGQFRQGELSGDLILDSNPQERERGITIFSKNCAVRWRDYKINLIDTPGHADFGGEVERVLRMADGCLLLVDAAEGPRPQTRYVLKKALECRLRPIVVINKVDRPDARVSEVTDEILELFLALHPEEGALDMPILYASGKHGFARRRLEDANTDVLPLFEEIVRSVPPPSGCVDDPLQMLVTTLDYNDYVGRIAVGRLFAGRLRERERVAVLARDGSRREAVVELLYTYEGLERKRVEEVGVGDIVAVAGIAEIGIGETIAESARPSLLPPIPVDEPTLTMIFSINTSPFSGRSGKYLTSRHLRERLMKELQSNVALRVEEMEQRELFRVSGRGLLHLEVVVETMRREGYEMMVGKPTVIYKEEGGERREPIEYLTVDVPSVSSGTVIEAVGSRRGQMVRMDARGDRCHLEFTIPARGCIGLRSVLLTATRGEAVMYHSFHGYEPVRGAVPRRPTGVMVATQAGRVTGYALEGLSDRGTMFVRPMEEVYAGQIIGEHCKEGDIDVNICRAKKMTNVRSSTAEATIVLKPPREFSLEAMLEYVEEDEWVEATPDACRMRKRLLDATDRMKARRASARAE
jgi:GTP-binding protein